MFAASHRKQRSGTTAVEFAFVAPVFMLFVVAVIEMWNINLYRNMASQAAYEASRAGVLPGATAETLEQIAIDAMRRAGAKNTQVDIQPEVITEETLDITVTVTVPIADNGWVFSKFFQQSGISRTSSLNREQISL